MPKSRKRKRKQPSTPPATQRHITQQARQSVPQIASHRSLWERFQNHPAWWLAGAVATLLTIGAAVWQVFQGPEISLADTGTTLPFQAPISVINKSWPFYMTDAYPICGIANLKFDRSDFKNFGIGFPSNKQTLAPGRPAVFQCKIINIPGNRILNADIYVSISYKMFGFWNRISNTMEITWFAQGVPPRWIVGHFPDHVCNEIVRTALYSLHRSLP